MPLFIKDSKRALFVHIPKTAGTSVETAFLDCGYDKQFLHRPGKGDGPDKKPCNPQHWHQELIRENIYPVLDGRSFFEFAIVRNPFTRLISEMMWKNSGGSNFDKDEFFKSLDKFGCNGMRTYKTANFHGDNHWRPQREFVGPNTVVFKYEEIKYQAWADLKMRFNLEELKTEFTHISLDKARPTKMNIEPTQEFKELYTEIYGEDHKQFGYDMPF